MEHFALYRKFSIWHLEYRYENTRAIIAKSRNLVNVVERVGARLPLLVHTAQEEGLTYDEITRKNIEKFNARWDRLNVPESGCWIWTSTCFTRPRKSVDDARIPFLIIKDPETLLPTQVYAKRWIFEVCYGPIPSGNVLNSKCGEPLCVNPDHHKTVESTAGRPRSKSPQ